MARPPISLKKIPYEGFKGRVLFHTHYNEYFKETVHMFNALDFLAELTQHTPPKGVQLIRRYGLYSSRIKGAWDDMPYVAERAPAGWKEEHCEKAPDTLDNFHPFSDDESIDSKTYKQAWERLLAKSMRWTRMCVRNAGRKMKYSFAGETA